MEITIQKLKQQAAELRQDSAEKLKKAEALEFAIQTLESEFQTSQSGNSHNDSIELQYGQFTERVLAVTSSFGQKTFGIPDVVEKLNEKYDMEDVPRGQLAVTLSNLARQGKIELRAKGAGRRSPIYVFKKK